MTAIRVTTLVANALLRAASAQFSNLMSSQRRINSSRRNGAQSRGPTSEAGKSRSSRNNLRHGILAQTVVLENEDKNAFIEYLTAFEDEHQPTDQTELDLVETMAVARWRVRRLWAMEKANLDEEMKQDHTPGRDAPTRAALAFRKLCDESRAADLLGRYETRCDRQYYRAYNLLLKKRASIPPASEPPPANLPFEPNPETEHPGNPSAAPPSPSVAPTGSQGSPPAATKLLALAVESKDTKNVLDTSFQIASGGVD